MSRAKAGPTMGAVLSVVGEVCGIVVQVTLIILGVAFILMADAPDGSAVRLLVWCLLGTLYWVGAVVWMNVEARRRSREYPITRRLIEHPLSRAVTTIATFCASLVGLGAAVELIVLRTGPEWDGSIELIAVWAMLLSWGLFHWGYARIYFARCKRTRTPTLLFPETPDPRLVDFVYFSFTNATTFSVSDVRVAATRMRWTVLWHTTLSFFLNALILALAINTIMSGELIHT